VTIVLNAWSSFVNICDGLMWLVIVVIPLLLLLLLLLGVHTIGTPIASHLYFIGHTHHLWVTKFSFWVPLKSKSLPREIESTFSFKEIKKWFPLVSNVIFYPTIVQPYLSKMNRIARENIVLLDILVMFLVWCLVFMLQCSFQKTYKDVLIKL
jgi:hypothetical protein